MKGYIIGIIEIILYFLGSIFFREHFSLLKTINKAKHSITQRQTGKSLPTTSPLCASFHSSLFVRRKGSFLHVDFAVV